MCPSLENLPEGILTLNGVVIIIESPGFKGFVRLSSENIQRTLKISLIK